MPSERLMTLKVENENNQDYVEKTLTHTTFLDNITLAIDL